MNVLNVSVVKHLKKKKNAFNSWNNSIMHDSRCQFQIIEIIAHHFPSCNVKCKTDTYILINFNTCCTFCVSLIADKLREINS